MRSLAAILGVLLCAWSTRAVAQDTAASPAAEPASAQDAPAPPPPLPAPAPAPPSPEPAAPIVAAPAPHVPEAAPHYQQPPPPPPQRWQWDGGPGDAVPRLHSGFYTHIQLMGGLFGAGDLTDGIEDGTGSALALGYSLWRDRLVAYVQGDILGDMSERGIGVGTLGIGLGYYLAQPNVMFALELGATTVGYTDEAGDYQDRNGDSVAGVIAYEWPIDGGPLAVGALLRLRVAAIEGDGSYFGATTGLSVTYH